MMTEETVTNDYYFFFLACFFPVLGFIPCFLSTAATYAAALSLEIPFFLAIAPAAVPKLLYFFFPTFAGI